MTATKGYSYLYGNSEGKPSDRINFAYAHRFNPKTLMKHYYRHGEEVGASSAADYEGMAITFANDVDNVQHDSYVDEHGSTHKFSYETGEFIIVSNDGTIITYFIPTSGNAYWENERRRNHIES